MSKELVSVLFVHIYIHKSLPKKLLCTKYCYVLIITPGLYCGGHSKCCGPALDQNARQVFCYYELDWNFNWSQSSIPLLFSLLIFVDTGQGMQN